MIRVSLIGSGNVAHHLICAFQASSSVELVQVYARRKETVSALIPTDRITSDINSIKEADVYIISISDDAIGSVSQQLPFSDRLVVHTSGTSPMTVLSDKNKRGVFYPLQTFSKTKALDFREVPMCLESEQPQDLDLLKTLAHQISDKVFEIDSEKRKALHVAAVYVSNFVNHLYSIGEEICIENRIPFEALKPLIKEVADKINYLSPAQAQTGPAKRADLKTIESHLEFLKEDSEKKEIYQLLNQSIMNKNKTI